MYTICAIVISLICSISAPSDIQLVEEYCEENFSSYEVVYFLSENWEEETICNRADTGKIYVEIFVSYSNGGNWGENEEGWGVAYNTDVPKGEKVISYIIYNPNTNYIDDAIAVVDNGKIR